MKNMERDAYSRLFVTIDKEKFFRNGIDDIVFIKDETIKLVWEALKQKLVTNGEIHIRGYGRDAKGTGLYIELYRNLFPNIIVKKDATNNAEPTKVLEICTEYSKNKNNKHKKHLIKNYQISHLFGRTKNPLLFTCPWNVAYMPKYLDPFTGHETQGEFSEYFKEMFSEILHEKFSSYITEYNELINPYQDRLEEILAGLDYQRVSTKQIERFKTEARKELSPITSPSYY